MYCGRKEKNGRWGYIGTHRAHDVTIRRVEKNHTQSPAGKKEREEITKRGIL
jgi:hypothetical protein